MDILLAIADGPAIHLVDHLPLNIPAWWGENAGLIVTNRAIRRNQGDNVSEHISLTLAVCRDAGIY